MHTVREIARFAARAGAALGLLSASPLPAADCDPVRDIVAGKAAAMIVGYPGPGQDHFVPEVQAALANNVRVDLQGSTSPIDESQRPHYCSAVDWWRCAPPP